MYDYTIYGRRLFSVSERTYRILGRCWCFAPLIGVALIGLAFLINDAVENSNNNRRAAAVIAATNSTHPQAITSEPTDSRANDVEPERMVIRSLNWAVANGSVKIRSRFGTTTTNFAWFCHSDGCEWRANVKDAFDLRLADGPYLVTAYNSANNPVATFRLDRTGTDPVEVITIYLLNNPREFTPMLSIEGVGNHFEPLGRETYPAKMEG